MASPADGIRRSLRIAHTAAEALNFLPCLYLTLNYELMKEPRYCDDPSHWTLYTVGDATYDNPCDMYHAMRQASHPVLLLLNIASLGGAIGVLTKCFWADHCILEQYLYASSAGLLGAVVVATGCLRLYRAASSFELWIEAQPPAVRASHRQQSERMLAWEHKFYALFV
jgi:hypothetical protein